MPLQSGLVYPAVRREIKVLSCPFLALVATPASSLSTHRRAKHHQPSPALRFSFGKRTFWVWVNNLGIPSALPGGGTWKKCCCKARQGKTGQPEEGEAHPGAPLMAAGGGTALRQRLSPSVSTAEEPSELDVTPPGPWSGTVLQPRPLLHGQQATHTRQPKPPPAVQLKQQLNLGGEQGVCLQPLTSQNSVKSPIVS